jgi:hypothetical protein
VRHRSQRIECGRSTPAARTPASLTTSGRRMPALAHSAGSRRTAPKSISIWVM